MPVWVGVCLCVSLLPVNTLLFVIDCCVNMFCWLDGDDVDAPKYRLQYSIHVENNKTLCKRWHYSVIAGRHARCFANAFVNYFDKFLIDFPIDCFPTHTHTLVNLYLC